MSPLRTRLWFYGCASLGFSLYVAFATWMPGESYAGVPPIATLAQMELQERLRRHVDELANTIGVRNTEHATGLMAARDYIQSTLRPFAVGAATMHLEELGPEGEGAQNIIFEVPGPRNSPVIVVGAHYDSVGTSPGANDNASGVAAALEIAKFVSGRAMSKTVRVALFANEEPPFFKNRGMGSRVSAQNARRRGDRISAMLALETIGFYSNTDGSQKYPWPVGLLYPSRGNFLGFVGDLGSRTLVRTAIEAFRKNAPFPSEGAALPAMFPGVDWSDHWAFRQAGYPAIMITDTAIYRDPNYHRVTDTPDKLDYDALALVTTGIEAIVFQLAGSSD